MGGAGATFSGWGGSVDHWVTARGTTGPSCMTSCCANGETEAIDCSRSPSPSVRVEMGLGSPAGVPENFGAQRWTWTCLWTCLMVDSVVRQRPSLRPSQCDPFLVICTVTSWHAPLAGWTFGRRGCLCCPELPEGRGLLVYSCVGPALWVSSGDSRGGGQREPGTPKGHGGQVQVIHSCEGGCTAPRLCGSPS